MKNCPDCGRELPEPGSECPSCKKKTKPPFTIQQFLWDNFRFFTMIGITGTMISLIPNMGTRILGNSWITNSYSFLPLFLSIIIFFGAVFLTICFFLIFGLILKDRNSESGETIISLKKKALVTWYDGDFQRIILLLCLVPMWIGLMLFFVLLIPLIPNKYSWLFASVPWLSGILFVLFAYAGWSIGKKCTGKIPGTKKFPRLSIAVFTLVGIGFYLLIFLAALPFFTTAHHGSGDITIRTDPQYFSPHISSAKGLRLDIMNITGSELDESRSVWSADYGYFINVDPTTSEVIIRGNPVNDDNSQDIFWTFSDDNPEQNKKPVRIDLCLYHGPENEEFARSSLYLTWYTHEIVYANRSFSSSP